MVHSEPFVCLILKLGIAQSRYRLEERSKGLPLSNTEV